MDDVYVRDLTIPSFQEFRTTLQPGSSSKEALWLTFSAQVDKHFVDLEKFNGRKVVLTGIINLSHKGHQSYYYATLSRVSCIKAID